MSTKIHIFMLTKIFIMISIYTISCPTTDNVVYVGQTKNLNERIGHHLTVFSGQPKCDWVKQTIKEGLKPVFKVIDYAKTKDEALKIESDLIRKYLDEGVDLLNLVYQKIYYQYDFEGNFIGTVISNKLGGKRYIKTNRLSYLGFVYNTEPVFPKWKVDEYRRAKSVNKKEVHQYSKDGVYVKSFLGVREACRITGIDHRSIAQVAGGSKTRRSAGGFVWSYKNHKK